MNNRSKFTKDAKDIVEKVINFSTITVDAIRSISSNIDNLNTYISNSSLVNTDAVKNITIALGNVVNIIQIISDNINEINLAMIELKNNQIISTLGNPQSLLTYIKKGKLDKDIQNQDIFIQYVTLLRAIDEISHISSNIDQKGLKQNKRVVRVALNSILDSYLYITTHKTFMEFFNAGGTKVLDKFVQLTQSMFNSLNSVILSLKTFIENSQVITRKDTRRAIKLVFGVYTSILWNLLKISITLKLLGYTRILKNLTIVAGLTVYLNYIIKLLEPVIEQLIKIGSSGFGFKAGIYLISNIFGKGGLIKSIKVNPTDIINLIIAIPAIIQLNTIFSLLQITIESLIHIGENYISAKAGQEALNGMFNGSVMLPSLFKILSPSINDIMSLSLMTVVASELNTIFNMLRPVVNLLIKLGTNYRSVKRGIRVLKLIVSGKGINKNRKDSVIDIFRGITVEDYISVAKFLPLAAMLSIAFGLLSITINTIVLMGKHYIRIMLGVRALRLVVNKLSRVIYKFNQQFSIKSIVEFAIKSLLLSSAIIPITILLVTLGSIAVLSLGAIITAANMVVVFTLFRLLFGIFKKYSVQQAAEDEFKLLSVALTISALAYTIETISAMQFNWKKIIIFSVVATALIVEFIGIVFILSKIGRVAIAGSVILLTLVGTMYLIAVMIEKISNLTIDYSSIGNFAIAALIITGLALALAIVTTILPMAIIGAGIMLVTVTILLAIAGEIMLLNKFKLEDIEQAKLNITKIFDVCDTILDTFINHHKIADKSQRSDKPWARALFKYVGGPIVNIIDAIFAFTYIASVFIAISLILLITIELKIISAIKLSDIDNAINNIDYIFDTIDQIIDRIIGNKKSTNLEANNSEDNSFLSAGKALIKYIGGPIINFVELIFAAAQLAVGFICISLITLMVMEFKLIASLEIDETLVIGKVDMVIHVMDAICDKVLGPREKLDTNRQAGENASGWEKFKTSVKNTASSVVNTIKDNPLTNAVRGVTEIIGNLGATGVLASALPSMLMLGTCVGIIKTINELEIDNSIISEGGKVDQILSIIDSITVKVSEDSKYKSIDEDKVDSFGSFTDSNIKLYKGINDLKTDKVTSLTQLYAQMTEFMNSIKDLDLDKITDALVNKISPALQDINETLDSTNQSDNNVSSNLGSKQVSSPTGSVNTSKESSVSSPTGSVNTQQETPEELKEIVQQLQVITNTLKNGLVVQGIV